MGGMKEGLSPRVRGNQRLCPTRFPSSRSIPACPGEPRFGARPFISHRVYPRVYGGTAIISRPKFPSMKPGLSPRVRGNQRLCSTRSPVCAAVYPRVYGGTPVSISRRRSSEPSRSIPACTGEPY